MARFTKPGPQNFNKPLFNFDNELEPVENNNDTMTNINNRKRLTDKKNTDKLHDNSGVWKDKPPDFSNLNIPRKPEIELETEQETGRTLNLRNRSLKFTR